MLMLGPALVSRGQESIYYLVIRYALLHYTFRIRPSNNLIIYNGEQKTWHVINSYSLYLRLIG